MAFAQMAQLLNISSDKTRSENGTSHLVVHQTMKRVSFVFSE